MRYRRPMARRRLSILMALGLGLVLPLAAQEWRGSGRASGKVTTLEGDAVAGARVILHLDQRPGEGPATVETKNDGSWSVPGLAPGRWQITIEADGYQNATGWIDVLDSRPTPALSVSLRSLDEVPPRVPEGNAQTVLGWIERGNTLLSQGQPADARAVYLRALPHLDKNSQRDVLRTVAQTYYLEKDLDAAADTLKEALGLDPGDETTRTLLATLLEGAGRGEEARTFLDQVDAGDRSQVPHRHLAEEEATGQESPEALPLVAATPGRLGRFRTRFLEKSPLNESGVLTQRLELAAEDVGEVYSLDGESWELFVPGGDNDQRPYGMFVWVSPDYSGGFTRDGIRELLEEYHLIWVGANQSGNERWTTHRYGLALDAAHNVSNLYPVDPNRVYVGGYSGGGRVASGLALEFSDVFAGGFFFFGCDFYRPIPVPDRPGTHWPARFPVPPVDRLKQLKKSHRFVLLTGTRDFNRSQTREVYGFYEKEGFRHVTLLEIPLAHHYHGFDVPWVRKGFDALDAPLDP